MPTILVVEDEAPLAAILQRVLTRAGYRVVQVPDGQAALDVLATMRPAVVVTNLHLPVLDGRTLCQRLAADPQYQAIPRIVIGGERLAVDDLPADTTVVPKPVALEVLLATVQQVVR